MYDLTGQRFGRLLVIGRSIVHNKNTKEIVWECQCDCGNTRSVRSYVLRKAGQVSCGCIIKENLSRIDNTKHGMYNTRTYHTWEGMKQRCLNPNATRFTEYGAKGITVCERWKSFENFFEDMGYRPEGKTLDRINPFGNYEPSNCRWATPYEQQHNQRRHRVVTEEV